MDRRDALKKASFLLGSAIAIPSSFSLLNGCQIDRSDQWKPSIFKTESLDLVGEIAETILPRTDTPGAKDIFAHRFIDQALSECFDVKTQVGILGYLDDIVAYISSNYQKSMGACSDEEKQAIVSHLESNAFQNKSSEEATYFTIIKGLSLLAYFTSEEGMTTMLNYHAIPQRYDGCIDMEPQARVYADNNVYK